MRILGERAKQISEAAKKMVISENSKSPMDIAILELKSKILPMKSFLL